MAPRIASAGEALVDLFPDTSDRTGFRTRAGGSPFNVAIGLARLGIDARYAGRLSTDIYGDMLRRRLLSEHVGTELVQFGPEPTAEGIVGHDADGPTYSFRWTGTADRRFDPATLPAEAADALDAVHLGSVALGIDPIGERLLGWMERLRGRVFLSLDPNVRADAVDDWSAYRRRVRRAVQLVDLVKASEQDLAALGVKRNGPRLLGRTGPTVVTARARGARVVLGDGSVVEVEAPAVEVVDAVGAGDATMAALLFAISDRDALRPGAVDRLDGAAWREILLIATTAGAMACESAGADPPTLAALRARLDASG